MSEIKPYPLAGNRPVIIAIAVGIFFLGLGIGYLLFGNANNPYTMMNNPYGFNQMMGSNPQLENQYMQYMMHDPQYMSQWMSQNPQYIGPWMGYMIQNPQLRQQMYNYMFQNKGFMYGMMGNLSFQNQYMGPWMMQNPGFQKQWTGTSSNQLNNTGTLGTPSGYYMSQGMMGSIGTTGSGYKTISIRDAMNKMLSPQNNALVIKDNDTIVFSSQNIDITSFAMMGNDVANMIGYNPPSSAHAQGDVFVINGLINPTLVVKSPSQLNISLTNLDEDMAHNFVITNSPPPYTLTPMHGMMGGYGGFLSMMPVLPNEDKQAGYAYEFSNSVTLNQPGTYWYICTYPGHAEEGMYGKIIVQ